MRKNIQKKEYERINEKNSIINFFPRLFWLILNKIKYKTIYFLDTNFIVANEESKDSRISKMIISNKNFFVSEPVELEVRSLLKREGMHANFNKELPVKSIKTLKENFPNACPLYYNFIFSMHNPGVINNPGFFLENIIAHFLSKKHLTNKENKLWGILMDKIQKSNRPNVFNEKKSFKEEIIEESFARALRKKKSSIKNNDENYLNDQKNIALALTHSILYRENTYIFSSDFDTVYHYLLLIDSLIQQMVLYYFLGRETEKDPNLTEKIYNNPQQEFFIFVDKREFDEWDDRIRLDVLSSDWKKGSFRFGLKFWHIEKKKYCNFFINFDERVMDMWDHLYGGIVCPFVRNKDYFNWINIRWFWPPPTDYERKNNLVKIGLKRKENLYEHTQAVPWIIHYNKCFYSSLDQNGQLSSKSGFTIVD